MIRVVTYEELCFYIRNLSEDIAKTILDAFEDMKKLIAELMDILEEKESYPKYSFSVFIIVCIMHYKRLCSPGCALSELSCAQKSDHSCFMVRPLCIH